MDVTIGRPTLDKQTKQLMGRCIEQLSLQPAAHAHLLHHRDAVGADDGGQPVGDHDGGAPHHEAVQRALHQLLALAVQRARGLVQ